MRFLLAVRDVHHFPAIFGKKRGWLRSAIFVIRWREWQQYDKEV